MNLYTALFKSSIQSKGYFGLLELLSYISWMTVPQRKFFLTICRVQSVCGVFVEDAFNSFAIEQNDYILVDDQVIPFYNILVGSSVIF